MRQRQHRLPSVYLQRRIRGHYQSTFQKRGLQHIDVRYIPYYGEDQTIPWTSKVFPDFAFTHSPLTYATSVFNSDGSLSFGTLCDIVEARRIYRDGKVAGRNRERESVRVAEAVDLKRGFMMKVVSKPEVGIRF